MLIKCTKCGFENQMGAIFCRGCGEKIDMNKLDPDTLAKNQKKSGSKVGKVIGKIFSILILIAIIAAIASIFVSYGLPAYKAAPADALKTANAKVDKIAVENITQVLPDTEFTMDEINVLLKKRFFKKDIEDKKDAVEKKDAANKKNVAEKKTDDKAKESVPAESTAKSKANEIIHNVKQRLVVQNTMVAAADDDMRVTVFATAFGYIPLRFEMKGELVLGNVSAPLTFFTKTGKVGYLPVPRIIYNKFISKHLAPCFANTELDRILSRAKKAEMDDGKLELKFTESKD